jgi:hypothetical protein
MAHLRGQFSSAIRDRRGWRTSLRPFCGSTSARYVAPQSARLFVFTGADSAAHWLAAR